MKNFALINNDGTIFNLVSLTHEDVIKEHPEWKELHFVEYGDPNDPASPRMHWTYNFETETWTDPGLSAPLADDFDEADPASNEETAVPDENSVPPLEGAE
jgi:hypothetical protein